MEAHRPLDQLPMVGSAADRAVRRTPRARRLGAPVREETSLDAAASLGLALDLADASAYDHAVDRCRELHVALPTFAQLADPSTLPPEHKAALSSVDPQAPDARNLFRVHWHNSLDRKS